MNLLPLVLPPCSYSIEIDIKSPGFDFGEHIRNHEIYRRFVESDGWCYIELLGEGSLEEGAKWVVPREESLSICFYTCDGLREEVLEE